MPVGLEDVGRYCHLTAELLKRGFTDDDIEKVRARLLRVKFKEKHGQKKQVLGGNVLRVWEAANAVAREMLDAGVPPSVARIEDYDAPGAGAVDLCASTDQRE